MDLKSELKSEGKWLCNLRESLALGQWYLHAQDQEIQDISNSRNTVTQDTQAPHEPQALKAIVSNS